MRCGKLNESLGVLCRSIAHRLTTVGPVAQDVQPYFAHMRRSLEAAVAHPVSDRAPAGDYSQLLGSALSLEPRDPITQALANLPGPLSWYYHYETRPGEADLSSQIAFAELVGPDGDMDAPDCRVGFTLMAPDTFYPLHAHPAIELYFVIAGNAEWRAGDTTRRVPPGELVLHRSSEPHSMRTFAEPLLALWSWSGDLDTPAYYL
jgi:mannose-6-phosphate isomerase-like protein (cupin superfamily)